LSLLTKGVVPTCGKLLLTSLPPMAICRRPSFGGKFASGVTVIEVNLGKDMTTGAIYMYCTPEVNMPPVLTDWWTLFWFVLRNVRVSSNILLTSRNPKNNC
jgi:hypothetical protein